MDLRVPVSLLFILLGAILAIHGLLQPDDFAAVRLGLRVNLIWGMVMCLFGVILGAAVLISRRRS